MIKAKNRKLTCSVGERLRELRRQAGLSQEDLAEKAGLHRTYVGSCERGERNISIVNLERLCRSLGVSMSEFLLDI